MKKVKRPRATESRPRQDDFPVGDAIPVPDVIEKDSDTAWALWSDAVAAQENQFQSTVPASLPTVPAPLTPDAPLLSLEEERALFPDRVTPAPQTPSASVSNSSAKKNVNKR